MKLLTTAIAAIWMALPGALVAQDSPVVVELFTSQGCSSCPPADKLMHELAKRDDVIPLALHVDYWDYIGWKDEYAQAAFTKRQRGYARVAGRKMIYTPQMVINGQDDVVGAHSMELADLIARHRDLPGRVTVMAQRNGDTIKIQAEAKSAPAGGALLIHLVQYTPERTAHITRGENAGRDLTYANVVHSWTVLGEWDARGPLDVESEISVELPAVVLIQQQGPGAIVAAARLE